MKLNLGVNDVLEVVNKSEPPKPLYDVALALESKYGVFSKFAEIHHDDIESELVKSVNGQLANILAGQPAGNPFQLGCQPRWRLKAGAESRARSGVDNPLWTLVRSGRICGSG